MSEELFEVVDGLFVHPKAVAAVKRSELEPDRCAVFLRGQSALDGFVVDRDADEVVDAINEALTKE